MKVASTRFKLMTPAVLVEMLYQLGYEATVYGTQFGTGQFVEL